MSRIFAMEKIKQFLIDLLQNHQSPAGKVFGGMLVSAIVSSVLLFVLETLPELSEYYPIFHIIDQVILTFFVMEYFLRILIAPNKLKFIFSPLGLLDFLVILPIFQGLAINFAFLRGFRMLEILRVLKVVRYSELMRTFFRSFKHYKEELKIFSLTFVIIWILASFSIYTFEHAVNPDLSHIGDALWWALVTMSTVGYGDVVAVTIAGKIISGLIIVAGLGTIAIMTAILTKIFIDHFFGKRIHHCDFCHFPHHDHDAKYCKNCGGELDVKKLLSADTIHPHTGRHHHSE